LFGSLMAEVKMTDIDQMEAGPELDALVVEKVMGWRWDEDWGCLIPPEQTAKPSEMWTDWQKEWDAETRSYEVYREPVRENLVSGIVYSGDSSKIITPRYSTDIAAAWEVALRMIRVPYSYEFYLCQQTDGWDVSFQHPGDKGGQAHGETASLAVCRAALKAVEGTGE